MVEARRLHYQRGPANPAAGTSTAKTPALTDGEGGRNKKSKDGRRIRFLGLRKGEDAEEGSSKPTRKSFWRRLRCW